MIPLVDEAEPTQEEITNKWFSQDIFAEAVDDGDLKRFDSDDEMQVVAEPENKLLVPKKPAKKKEKKISRPASNNLLPSQQEQEGEGFEVVSAPETDSSSSDESDIDDDTKAHILGVAKKMLRKKMRNNILDDAYNKYMFDDEGLPKWFLDEESKHRQPIKPVTKEEIEAIKAQFKEINTRPAKKVAEAKARKKRVAMRKLEKVRKKANVISDQTEISDRSKMKQIEKLYKKATPKRPEKEYVVAKKGVQVRTGPGKVLVDRRMKKDLRAMKSKKGKDGKGGSKKGKGNGKGNSKSSKTNNGFAKSPAGKTGKMGGRGKKPGRA